MGENIFRFTFTEGPISSKDLEKLIKTIDFSLSPVQTRDHNKPSDNIFKVGRNLNSILGKANYSGIEKVELIRYPDSRKYIEVDGYTAKVEIEKKLKTLKIDYFPTLEPLETIKTPTKRNNSPEWD